MGPSVALSPTWLRMISQRQPASEVPPGCRRGARGPGAATAAFRTLRRSLARSHRDAALLARGGAPLLTSTRDGGPRFGVTGLSGLTLKRTRRLGFMLGELVQTTDGKWITHPPTRCPNGHTLGANQVLVGHQACLGHGGGHTTWTCRECDLPVYGPPLNSHCMTLDGPATVRISNR